MEESLVTSQEAAKQVFDALVTGGLKAATSITGAIYRNNRPQNSTKEDVVITTLAMNAEQLQEGVINVNVHVPNLSLAGDNTQPNEARFNTITRAAVELLDNYWGTDSTWAIEEPGTLVRDGANWFSNIRLRYFSLRD